MTEELGIDLEDLRFQDTATVADARSALMECGSLLPL